MTDESEVIFRNCLFRFKCPESWDDLERTENENVRHCGLCERPVHFCDSYYSLVDAIEQNHCVAVKRAVLHGEPDGMVTIGEARVVEYQPGTSKLSWD